MCYKSIDLYISKDNKETLFLKKTRPSIYDIFIDMEKRVLKTEKFEHIKIEFHYILEDDQIHFTKWITHTGGRTIFSCMKEMVKYLVDDWNIEGMGHFSVCVEE